MSLLPQLNYEIDINEPLKCTEFTAVQGSDFQIVIRVKRYGVLQTLENVTASLKVANSDESWIRTFTGTAGGANDESIIIPVDGDTLDSNGEMDYDIVLTDGDSNNIVHRRGKFLIYEDVPGGATPPAGNPIDWSAFSGYSNTATNGPYTAGTGIAFGTADVDGKVPINATATSAEWGNITGTLADQTDLQAELDAKADDSAVVKLAGVASQDVTGTGGTTRLTTTGSGARIFTEAGAAGASVTIENNDGSTRWAKLVSTASATYMDFSSALAFRSTPDDNNTQVLNLISTQIQALKTILCRENVRPETDNVPSLGTSSLKWLSAYISTLYSGAIQALTSAGLTLKDDTGTTLLEVGNDARTHDVYVNGVIETSGGSAIGTNILSAGSLNAQDKAQIRINGSNGILESLDGAGSIYVRGRTSGAPTGDVYLGGLGEKVYSDDTLPRTDGTFALGTSSLKWLAAYISTLYTSAVQALTSAGGALKSNNGTTCASWGGGGGANFSTSDGLSVGGTLSVTNKQASLINLTDTNVETLAGTKTLTTSSEAYQILDPDGADRDVDLPTVGRFSITNSGSANNLTVYESDGTTAITDGVIGPGVTLGFVSTGTDTWTVLG